MANDIVERLLEAATPSPFGVLPTRALYGEAAAEITRLRAELAAANERLAKAMLYPEVPKPSTPEAEISYWIAMTTRERLVSDELEADNDTLTADRDRLRRALEKIATSRKTGFCGNSVEAEMKITAEEALSSASEEKGQADG